VWIAIGLAVLVAAIALLVFFGRRRPDAAKMMADGTYAQQFVWIDDDGTARELTDEEKDYLNTDFHPTDGARPNIKFKYDSLTPDGKMRGYLWRHELPLGMPVSKPPR
jgi:hypothetical protein